MPVIESKIDVNSDSYRANREEMLRLIDEDTEAFNRLMASFGLPKSSDAEKAARSAAIQEATRGATEVPLRCMRVALESLTVARAMAEIGLPASVSDAGVAALCARAAVHGAYLNVRINAGNLKDAAYVKETLSEAEKMIRAVDAQEREILEIVTSKL